MTAWLTAGMLLLAVGWAACYRNTRQLKTMLNDVARMAGTFMGMAEHQHQFGLRAHARYESVISSITPSEAQEQMRVMIESQIPYLTPHDFPGWEDGEA